jgi:GNAT superfamily N-acetyltransferase
MRNTNTTTARDADRHTTVDDSAEYSTPPRAAAEEWAAYRQPELGVRRSVASAASLAEKGRSVLSCEQLGEYSIRPARAEDAKAVSACVDEAYRHYIPRLGMPPGPMTEDYEAVIRDCRVTVVEGAGGIVAVLVLVVADEGFLLENVAVLPSHQGTGLGRHLLEMAEREAWLAGFDSIYLYTHERMTENRAMYGRIGYEEYARRVEMGLRRVYMRKQLEQRPPR